MPKMEPLDCEVHRCALCGRLFRHVVTGERCPFCDGSSVCAADNDREACQ